MADDVRTWTDEHGETWTFTRRRRIRRDEEETHIALVARSATQVRIVTCRREEWETENPVFSRLLGRSMPAGGSRGAPPGAQPEPPKPDDGSF